MDSNHLIICVLIIVLIIMFFIPKDKKSNFNNQPYQHATDPVQSYHLTNAPNRTKARKSGNVNSYKLDFLSPLHPLPKQKIGKMKTEKDLFIYPQSSNTPPKIRYFFNRKQNAVELKK